jgi:hypothetical protein
MLQPNDRFFFHTFPRPKRDETAEETLSRAVEVLRFIKEGGLILAPELVTWRIPTQEGGVQQLQVLQQRACFTELSFSELGAHAATFGPVTLSFDINQLREAGLTPVIYVPQGAGLNSLSQIATVCANAAWHTRHVLGQLQQLKEMSDPEAVLARHGRPLAPNAVLTLRNNNPEGAIVAEYVVPAANVDAVMKHVGYRNIPFDHSVGMLTVFLKIFYPTDNLHTGELLGYYRQREWRLIGGGLQFNGRPIARALTQAEIERLQEIDAMFWRRELTVDDMRQPRYTLAQVYSPTDEWKFFDLVKNVFAPRPVAERVGEIVGDKLVVA